MVKRFFSVLALCGALLTASAAEADYNVVPLPQSVTLAKTGKDFVVKATTPVVYVGSDAAMLKNAEFLAEYIGQSTGMKLAVSQKKVKKTPSIVLVLDKKVIGDEAYEITVTEKQVTVAGSTAAGVFYGIQTLRKAMPVLSKEEDVTLPPAFISDAPRFAYRGMMLDCGRHFWSVDFVKKFIDMLALHNMNRFHWHLSEDQGWRIEIKKHPELTKIGAYRTGTVVGRNSDLDDGIPYGGFYTQEQAREVVEYARQRHITVIPEIDLPGHTEAVLATYPEFGCTGGPYEVEHKWGVFPDVLCIGNEKIYPFLQDVIDELCDIFPSKYIHIGGDECPTDRWKECSKCKALAAANNVDMKHLQSVFTNRMEKYINSKGRSIIGWDEILEGKINKSATVMNWHAVDRGVKAAEMGHDVIMVPMSHAYFDYYQTKVRFTEPLCIGGYLPVSKTYEFDPAPASMSPEVKKHILGVQANLWTEYIPFTNMVEYMVLPRMGALAEVQWMRPEQKNFEQFKVREKRMTQFYDRLGLKYAKHIWKTEPDNSKIEW